MSKFADELIESLTEPLVHARGEKTGVRVHAVEVPDARAIRHGPRMSREKFAVTYRIPLSTLKNWEQGRRHPDAPAAAYLQAISRVPVEISEALLLD